MGTKQWTDTYCSELTADVSPAIVDMFGSVRSKIFSILKIIERDGDKYETAKKHYKVLLDELPIKDRVRSISGQSQVINKVGRSNRARKSDIKLTIFRICKLNE